MDLPESSIFIVTLMCLGNSCELLSCPFKKKSRYLKLRTAPSQSVDCDVLGCVSQPISSLYPNTIRDIHGYPICKLSEDPKCSQSLNPHFPK